ncbi:MAG: di-trans,poly-cis-decaprenylcistransferase [Nanoarchaeota archaeon]|nr:di-trans,poly-cis-decaprenylcistransferase [Nanoarchaeota archaeon]MBU1321398.1 di-trans,poly-cis-decaprenylcistransferase [Nanoarchaeota archaeon]MBU1597816.1 di-trans,poly-cis-decaprenylcistransferase [Nanoarchaeota archaeon]MBU2441920.1 di-trans,poly-cis-decaprenylcistransferase [Nanoarchaeota archaeon]
MTSDKPIHIAVIPDGNRRFAKSKGKLAWKGHEEGAKVFENFLEWCKEEGIKEITFWAASTENVSRDKQEVDFLIGLFDKFCNRYLTDHHKGKIKDKARIRFIGNLEQLPAELVEKMKKIKEITKDYSDYKLNLLVNYGGRWEIIQAAKSIAREAVAGKINVDNIDSETFQKHLALDSEPDLIIRTSEQRLSGLLPWQGIYSEIIFLKDKFWPEFTKEDLKKCLDEYAERKRRFGK